MECVVKKTRTMEASIVVIAFQKEIVPVNLKVEVERFDLHYKSYLYQRGRCEGEGGGGE